MTNQDLVYVLGGVLIKGRTRFSVSGAERAESIARHTLKSKFSLTSPSVRPCIRASNAITLNRRRPGSSN